MKVDPNKELEFIINQTLCRIDLETFTKESNQLESFPTNLYIFNKHLLGAFCKLFYLLLFVSSDQRKHTLQQTFYCQFKRRFYMKMIVTIVSTNLATNLLLSPCYTF